MADTCSIDFCTFLKEQSKGQSAFELSQALESLVKEVKRTGKKGALTYKVTVEPNGRLILNQEVDQVTISDDITVKLPKMPRRDSIFFTTDRGGLSRNDPRQMEFDDKPANPVARNVTGEKLD